MEEALKMAALGLQHGEVPVGCVAVFDGRIIAKGCNEVNISRNATRHAEMIVIDQILQYSSGNYTLFSKLCNDSVLFVTVEPCVMCASALKSIGLSSVVYGCNNYQFGGCGSLLELDEKCRISILESAVEQEKSIALLQKFYKENPK